MPEPTNPAPDTPPPAAPAEAIAIPAVAGDVVRAALERRGWIVVGHDPAYWAMRKGGSFPLMVPTQSWPLAEEWLREILKDAEITVAEFVALIAQP